MATVLDKFTALCRKFRYLLYRARLHIFESLHALGSEARPPRAARLGQKLWRRRRGFGAGARRYPHVDVAGAPRRHRLHLLHHQHVEDPRAATPPSLFCSARFHRDSAVCSVQVDPSGRATCKGKCRCTIPKGSLRVDYEFDPGGGQMWNYKVSARVPSASRLRAECRSASRTQPQRADPGLATWRSTACGPSASPRPTRATS